MCIGETAAEVAEGDDFGLAIAIMKSATEKFSKPTTSMD